MSRSIFLVLALVAVAPAHAVLVIDNFRSGDYDTGLLFKGGEVGWTPASVPGGIRRTSLQVIENQDLFDARLRVRTRSSVFAVSTDPGVEAVSQLGYGFALDDSTFGSNPLNLTMGSQLGLDFRSNDLDLRVEAYLYAGSVLHSSSKVVPGGFSGLTYFDFSGSGADLTDVDAILFNFAVAPGGDFALNGVEAVPEPASMTAFALGAAALIRRRKKA